MNKLNYTIVPEVSVSIQFEALEAVKSTHICLLIEHLNITAAVMAKSEYQAAMVVKNEEYRMRKLATVSES